MLVSNLRGGVAFTAQRYTESAVYEDQVGKPRTLDEEGRFNILLDLDANNLYGSSQVYPLPCSDLTFLSKEEIKMIDWRNVDLFKDVGYFVEVTLDYPPEIRERTKSYPLCPENINITMDMLSPYQKSILTELYGLSTYKARKLTATFHRRKEVTLHGLTLQFYLAQGMQLVEVHRVIRFKQAKFMKKWVDFCTKKRSESTNDFDKNIWKLNVNATYGKTIESVEDRFKVTICTTPEKFAKKITSSYYIRHVIINPDLVIVYEHLRKATVKRPYYIGFAILEISKLIMYNLYYSILQNHFGPKGIELVYSDTDSLAVVVKTKDIIEDFKKLSSHMDFSNLNPSHPLFDPKNKAQLFKLKEEFGFAPLSRMCAIKSKVYSFEVACSHDIGMNSNGVCSFCRNKQLTPHNINRLKGIQKRVTREIHFSNYLKCIQQPYIQRELLSHIESKKHQVSTVLINKISLSSFDDKRYLLNCGIHTEPYSPENNPFCTKCNL